MGAGDWQSYLFGGSATSPQDYQTTNPYGQQVQGAYNQGMGAAAPQLNSGPQDQFRNAQMNQLGQLSGIASGQQQGAGELATQRQVQNALAGQQAMAHMARGGNSALAMRQGARNAAGIGLSGAGQAQQAAMGDQMNAQGLLTQAVGQGRGQDIGMAGQNAQLQQQQQQLQQQWAQMLSQMGQGQLNTQAAQYGAAQGNPGIAGGLISAGGQVGAAVASDERLKTEISDGGNDIDAMLDALIPKRYRYKDEKHGKGPRIGILAQDMERSKAGRDVVVEMPDGKGLDVNKALSAALASAARLNKRLRKLEAA